MFKVMLRSGIKGLKGNGVPKSHQVMVSSQTGLTEWFHHGGSQVTGLGGWTHRHAASMLWFNPRSTRETQECGVRVSVGKMASWETTCGIWPAAPVIHSHTLSVVTLL